MVENIRHPSGSLREPHVDHRMRRDLRTLARFISVYCRGKHPTRPHSPNCLRPNAVPDIPGIEVDLCDECKKLLTHALVKRFHCPLDPKPACKKCSCHCYHPKYRSAIKEVMRYSGRELLLSGRIDYLLHLLF